LTVIRKTLVRLKIKSLKKTPIKDENLALARGQQRKNWRRDASVPNVTPHPPRNY